MKLNMKYIGSIYSKRIKNELIKRLISGSFWNLSGSIISRGLMTLAWIIVARVVGKEIYGQFGIIRSSLSTFQVLASFGLGITATKYIAELKFNDKTRTSRIIGFTTFFALISGGTISILFYIFSKDIAITFLNTENLIMPLRLSALILFFISINSIQIGILNGFEDFKRIAKINLVQGLVALPVYTLLSKYFQLEGIILAYILSMVILVLVSQIEIAKVLRINRIKFTFRQIFEEYKVVTTIGLPATLTALLVTPSVWISNIFIVNTNNGYEQLGIFNGILIFSTFFQLLGTNFNNVLLPIYLNENNNKNINFINYYGFWFLTIFLSLPIIYIYEIPSLIMGEDYLNPKTLNLLGIIFFYTFIISHRQGIGRELISKNKMWLSFFSMGQFAITLIVLVYLLKSHGAFGIAIANLISYAINLLVFGFVFSKNKLCSWRFFYGFDEMAIWASLLIIILPQIYILPFIIRLFLLILHLSFISYLVRKIYVENNS